MLGKVKTYIEKWKMLTSEDCVIVGVSGGADSVCLLLVLLELQKKMEFRMVAVHVNHGLRGADADADEKFVRNLCEERGVLCEVFSADVESIAKNRKLSTEEAGREVRREFFAQACERHGGTKIALAHHQNDNAETFFFRLARGAGMKGLGGMAPVNGRYIRPLLCVERGEIESFLEVSEASFCVDQSNHEDIYARNRIRNKVVPQLEQGVNSRAVAHINRTMEHLREVQLYLEEQLRNCWEQCVKQSDSGLVLLEEEYQKVPKVLQSLLIKELMVRVSGHEKDVEEVHVSQVEELFEKQVGRRIDLPYQMEALRAYDGVEICRRDKKAVISEEILFDIRQGEADYEWHDRKIRCRILNKMQIDGETLEKSHTKCFNCDIIKHGICFRTRRQGDYITVYPDGKTQKLNDYFINQKIPQRQRDQILLVADGNHVLWIVGYRVGCAYQTKENTKCVLEIHIDEGEENDREN